MFITQKISLSGGNWPLIYPKMLKWKFSLRFILAGALYQEEVTPLKGFGETTFEVLEGIYYYTSAQKLKKISDNLKRGRHMGCR